ncbi:conserved Plasmodium protein, unknown function [Plasmodium berghei]|uniref:Uncharacterized protein n=2 Tax=Plasmodium berghei TaxID=5821 RepID=A0A509AN11_PLABA|nr:conserved Plasmodium protein, unknown function [Plasmodium berghei ANKA]CXI53101.1 conserved Plasmodium protein, unknown function [Plasmodium berghei]SCL94748.1 conserved Plasmodium protein, unknown function [Plasmodium berghei]SCM16091.1 conserved Plasmodium protein, unknown function [Plasmodium berghei]SCM17887.1 conserved Plasmodium protein, unknown function [Plasmodium berghei]SCN26210.1 conserved Plasmodium protein, unknown function [Plasmodium berghei]|eukprot:XP_034422015.1 conserved Plasmodium protein, unknown function [Plasmodium berghei ANKA]
MKNSLPKESSKFCIKSKQTNIRDIFEENKTTSNLFYTKSTTYNNNIKTFQPAINKNKTTLVKKKPINIECKQIELNKSENISTFNQNNEKKKDILYNEQVSNNNSDQSDLNKKYKFSSNFNFKSEISKNDMMNYYYKDAKNKNIEKEKNVNLMKQDNKEINFEKVTKIRNNQNNCNGTLSIVSAFVSYINTSNVNSNVQTTQSYINENDDVVSDCLVKTSHILSKKKTNNVENPKSNNAYKNICVAKQNKGGKLTLKMKSYNSYNNKHGHAKKNSNTNIKSVDDADHVNNKNNNNDDEKESKTCGDNLCNENYIKMEELLKDYNEAVKNKKDSEFDINDFIERYDNIIDGLFKVNNIDKYEIKKSILKKYKQIFENKNAMKFYKGIKTLVYEKNIIVQYMEYYRKLNKQYIQDLKDIQSSYDSLITEANQVNQNNIMLKRLINVLSIDLDKKKIDLST